MRSLALLSLASLLLYAVEDATAPAKRKPTPGTKSKAKSSTQKSSTHRKTTAKSGKTSKTGTKRGKGSRSASASTWRSRQLAPTPERYKEIQSALVQRGYLKKDASGVWDADSTDALKRFQQDQSLEASGKLNSLSLIALGLGPKHNAPAPAAPHPPASQAPVTSPPPSGTPPPEPPAPTPSGPASPGTQL